METTLFDLKSGEEALLRGTCITVETSPDRDPCVATFVVLFKELGARDLLKATVIMVVSTLLVGGFLNLLL